MTKYHYRPGHPGLFFLGSDPVYHYIVDVMIYNARPISHQFPGTIAGEQAAIAFAVAETTGRTDRHAVITAVTENNIGLYREGCKV
jgi:hypothetical protein